MYFGAIQIARRESAIHCIQLTLDSKIKQEDHQSFHAVLRSSGHLLALLFISQHHKPLAYRENVPVLFPASVESTKHSPHQAGCSLSGRFFNCAPVEALYPFNRLVCWVFPALVVLDRANERNGTAGTVSDFFCCVPGGFKGSDHEFDVHE